MADALQIALDAAGPAPVGYEAMPVNFGCSLAIGGGFKRGSVTTDGYPIYRWEEPQYVSNDWWRIYFVPLGTLNRG